MSRIKWVENNTPKSDIFGDIYYNPTDGFSEKLYVFVESNDLIKRFKDADKEFKIMELGFGTGLSFIITALEFLKTGIQHDLIFTSTELYPLTYSDLEKALMVWPELQKNDFVEAFLNSYQEADLSKDITINIKNIKLEILVGDAQKRVKEIKDTYDCFFLDGFAPGKNQDMWSFELFEEIKRISNGGSTCSTYSASRVVKDRMEQAGFKYEIKKGFGQKRNMLVGYK